MRNHKVSALAGIVAGYQWRAGSAPRPAFWGVEADIVSLDLPPPPTLMPELRASVADWSSLYVGGQLGITCLEAHYISPGGVDPNMAGCTGMGGV